MSSLDAYVRGWNPQPVVDTEPMPLEPARALAAVLEVPEHLLGSEELPPLWHWVYFLHWPAHGALGRDGHPTHGHFLPPLPDRRRMFAGGRMTVTRPLQLGQPAERSSSLASATVKHGRSGEMVLVTVRSEFRQHGEFRLVEEQDYVYRSGEGAAKSPRAAPSGELSWPDATWKQPFVGDPVRLFRFSALTANAHRIHYDEPYAREVEAYPGLVVHGPMLVLLMTELARSNRSAANLSTVDYRLHRPVFAGDPVLVAGEPDGDAAELVVRTAPDTVSARAQVTFV